MSCCIFTYSPVEQEVMAEPFYDPSQPGVAEKNKYEYTSKIYYS